MPEKTTTIRVTFKDPDWDDGVLMEAAEASLLRGSTLQDLDGDEKECLLADRVKKYRDALRPYLPWNEYLEVDFTIDEATGQVVEAKVVKPG